ncbi:GTPase ObgE [Candidatus Saccharibacteria bacterium]|nr:GTPase ObgE [Candidatus Saccharibacteria bacterium]
MFVDTAKVLIQAGKGGDGAVSFRHEIYVDKGGPDGGDGGRGGDVIFVGDESVNTLLNFRYKPELKAENGQNGSKAKRRGKSGEHARIHVPVGTIVTGKDGTLLADILAHNQEVVVAKGGDGGFGNAHFKSSVRQTPRIAELGEPGDCYEAELELKLLADVGLIGFPNAGKSTFLSVVTNARPEIANYAFTTLTPNLGVADIDDGSLLIADIPGLIEGASEGKGLGDDFLRHVERTAVLLHLIDAYTDDIAKAYAAIRSELEKYNPELVNRPEIVALTKSEGLDDEIIAMQREQLAVAVGDKSEIYVVSAHAHHGLKEVLRALRRKVAEVRKAEDSQTDDIVNDSDVIRLSDKVQAEGWTITTQYSEELDALVYVVEGEKIEKFARRTNFDGFENVNRLRDIMKKMGIMHDLQRAGASGESVIQINDTQFTFFDQQ